MKPTAKHSIVSIVLLRTTTATTAATVTTTTAIHVYVEIWSTDTAPKPIYTYLHDSPFLSLSVTHQQKIHYREIASPFLEKGKYNSNK